MSVCTHILYTNLNAMFNYNKTLYTETNTDSGVGETPYKKVERVLVEKKYVKLC